MAWKATMYSQVGRLSRWTQDGTWPLAQGTFNFTDNLSITAGLRYTEETKKAYARHTQFATG